MQIKILHTIIILTVFNITIFAQNPNVSKSLFDKYILQAEKYTDIDIDSVNTYCSKAKANINKNTKPDRIQYLELLILNNNISTIDLNNLKIKLKSLENIKYGLNNKILFYIAKGYYHRTRSHIDSCYQYYNEALNLSKKSKNKKLKISALLSISWYYRVTGDIKKSISYDIEQLQLIKKINDTRLYIPYYITVGNSYYNEKDFSTAREYYKKALFLSNTYKLDKHKSHIYNNIGASYTIQRNSKLSFYYYKRCIETSKKTKNKLLLALAYRNMSHLYLNNKNLDSAKYYLNKSLDIYNLKKEKSISYVHAIRTLAEINVVENKYSEALKNIKYADSLLNKNNYNCDLDIFKAIELQINLYTTNNNFEYLSKEYSIELEKNYNYKKTILARRQKKIILAENYNGDKEIYKSTKTVNKIYENKKTTAILIILITIGSLLLTTSIVLYIKLYRKRKIKNKKIRDLKTSLNSLDIFLSAITNDMQSPFQEILCETEFIESIITTDKNSLEELIRHIEKLDTSATQIYLLINNLLIWSTTQNNKLYSKKNDYNISENIVYIRESFPEIHIKQYTNYKVYANKFIVNFIVNTTLNYTDRNNNASIYISKDKKNINISIESDKPIFKLDNKLSNLNFRLCKNLANINNGNLVHTSTSNIFKLHLQIPSSN